MELDTAQGVREKILLLPLGVREKVLLLPLEEQKSLLSLPKGVREKVLLLPLGFKQKMFLPEGVREEVLRLPPGVQQKITLLPDALHRKIIILPPDVREKILLLPLGVREKILLLPLEEQKSLLSLPKGVREEVLRLPEDVREEVLRLPPGVRKEVLRLPEGVREKVLRLPPGVREEVLRLPPEGLPSPGKARETNLQENNMKLQDELKHAARATNLQENNMKLQDELKREKLRSAQLEQKIKAQAIKQKQEKSRSTQLEQKIKEQEIKLKELRGLPRYKMSSRPRGICVIINNINFRGEWKRVGAEFDESELARLYTELHFEVHRFRDLQWDEMRKVAVDFAKKDHSQFDAFVFIVMSHGGDKDVVYGVSGRHTRVEDLMSDFKAANCQTLRNKPKLFIIQTCRGSSKESLSPASCDSDTAAGFSPDSTLARSVCPQEADFLLSFATAPGYKAWRYPGFGSPYIQFLVEEIRKHHHSHHLLDILTEVNRCVVEEGIRDGKAIQCPAPTHTLQGQVFL